MCWHIASGTFRIRGRHLLVLDLLLLSATFALLAQWVPYFPLYTFVLVTTARAIALIRSGVYQHARPLLGVTEIVRLGVALVLGSAFGHFVSYILVAGPKSDAALAAGETASALGVLAAYRALLGLLGVTRRGPADEIVVERRIANDVPVEMGAMIEAMRKAPEVYRPSRFWQSLNQRHAVRLAVPSGLSDFKRTLNTSYFQFGIAAFARSVPALVREWLRHPDRTVWSARSSDGSFAGRVLAVLVALYANALRGRPHGYLVDRLVEPEMGQPIFVSYGGRVVTEDLCHSIEEYDSVMTNLPAAVELRRIVEIGAGYGRLAWVFASLHPEAQYCVVDIPPALYVSQHYLTTVLPDVRVFRFRPFFDYGTVAEEMSSARLVFLEPQQMDLLPAGYADLVLTVSTLHEMRADQVRNYFKVIDRICGGAFYSKQWRQFYNHADDVSHHRHSYPVPPRWTRMYEGTPLVPPGFFEALYACRPTLIGT